MNQQRALLSSLSIERQKTEFFVVLRSEDAFRAFGVATSFKAAQGLLAAIRRDPAHYGIH